MTEAANGIVPLQERDRELLEVISGRLRFRGTYPGECAAAGLVEQRSGAIIFRTAPTDGFALIATLEELWDAPDIDRLRRALGMRIGDNDHLDVLIRGARPDHVAAAADRLEQVYGKHQVINDGR